MKLAEIVEDFLKVGAVGSELRFDDPQWRVYYHSLGNERLFGGLAIQLLLAVACVDGFATCSACGRPYMPERTPKSSQNHFCSAACRKKGWALSSRRYRAAKAVQKTKTRADNLAATTGRLAASFDSESVRRQPHVEVSSIMEIDGISPDLATRLTTLFTSATNSRQTHESLYVQTIYNEERARMKITVVGDMDANASIFRLIGAFDSAPTRRHRHVEVSSIVEINATNPDLATRLTTLFIGATNSWQCSRQTADSFHVQTIYDKEHSRVKIILLNDMDTNASIFRLIGAFFTLRAASPEIAV